METITKETIIKMEAEAHLESIIFEKDTLKNLLKKYRGIQGSSEYIEESASKFLQEQIESAIKHIAKRESEIKLFEMMKMFLGKTKEDES